MYDRPKGYATLGGVASRQLGADTCAQSLNVPVRAIQSITEQINMMNDMAYRLWSNMTGDIDRISGAEPMAPETASKGRESISELDALRQSADRLHDHLAACLAQAQRLTSI